MGRGRQKAKQRKVARKLKYFSPETDFSALQRELDSSRYRDSDDEDATSDWDYSEIPPAIDDDWPPKG